METYEYQTGVTSQLPFCATPLRLDAYNRCQFACQYCFASTRQGFGRNGRLQAGSPKALEKRLARVRGGNIQSALDEFIAQRIPFQLGGMSDPFAPIERTEEVTLKYLKILRDFDYPFILSTKSDLVGTSSYLRALEGSNAYIRFSMTAISHDLRSSVDKGTPSPKALFAAAKELVTAGIHTSLRLQPIVPKFEPEAFRFLEHAARARMSHVSLEFLKVPIDANIKFGSTLIKILGDKPTTFYRSLGANRLGREYVLPLEYRAPHLLELYKTARRLRLKVGFADNELLLHSDGNSCCGASDLFLKNANFFRANVIGAVKRKKHGELLHFADIVKEWHPKRSLGRYLNSTARLMYKCFGEAEWVSMLRQAWLGSRGVYSPDFFDGVRATGEVCADGLRTFVRERSAFEIQLANQSYPRVDC